MTKRSLVLLFVFIEITIFASVALVNTDDSLSNQEKGDLKVASSATLDYGDYASKYAYCYEDDIIIWEFESSNSLVGIEVYAMDEADYEDFVDGWGIYGYELSDGYYTDDSGEWDVVYSDEWYIVFINDDSDMLTTELDYDVEFDTYNPYDPYGPYDPYAVANMIAMIFGIVIGSFLIIGLPLIIVKKVRGRSQQTPSGPTGTYASPPQTTLPATTVPVATSHEVAQFCSSCGAKTEPGTTFCQNCGTKIED